VIFYTDSGYVDYLNNPNGTIFKCYLKTPLNIFNMRSKVDFYKLNKELNFSRMDSAIYKTLDWTYDVLSYKRDIVIDTIYDFGEYDGFFNFESLDKPENPSIGIFDKNNIILEKVWTIEEYKLINRKVFESIKNDIELKTLLEFFKANGIQLTSENSRLLKAEFYT